MTHSSKRKIWLLPGLLLLFLLGCWLTFRSFFVSFTPPALPSPNGYDDLLKAAAMLAPRTGFYDEMPETELADIVQQNEPWLELAREALQKPCVVALEWSADRAWLDVHVANVSSMKELARAFAAAALHAQSNNRIEAAVRCGLDTLELAQVMSQGGILIDRGMAGGVLYTGLYTLRDQVDQLASVDCLRLLKKLQASRLKLEPPEQVLQRESDFFQQITGALRTFMMRGVIRAQRQQALDTMDQTDQQHAMMELLLQTHLAVRAYSLDNNQLPENLAALAPRYLIRVPRDSFSTDSLIYRPTPTGYLLYSVGSNGIDDGGKESTDGADGDILLDAIK